LWRANGLSVAYKYPVDETPVWFWNDLHQSLFRLFRTLGLHPTQAVADPLNMDINRDNVSGK
jgi:hypothetical protein